MINKLIIAIKFFSLSFIVSLLIIPVILIFLTSFQTFDSIQTGGLFGTNPEWTSDNYSMLLSGYWESLSLTVLILSIKIFISLSICLISAFAFSQLQIPFRKFFYFILLFAFLVPDITLLSSNYLLVNSLGFTQSNYGIIMALVLPSAFSFVSFLILKSGFDKLNKNLKNISISDSQSNVKYFFLTLSEIKKEIFYVVILISISSWNAYIWPRLLLMGSDYRVLTMWIYDVSLNPIDNIIYTNVQMAASVLASIPLILIFIGFRNQIYGVIKQNSRKNM